MFLLEHDGEEAEFVFYPKVDKAGTPQGRGFTGTVTIGPPDQIGNAASGTFATFQATLPLKGMYTMIDASGTPIPPPAVAATGSTPGSPGAWVPANATPPADMASAPTTGNGAAWAADQYVQTATAGTAGEVTWNGAAWAAYTGVHKAASEPGDAFPSETVTTASDSTNAAKLGPAGYVALPTSAWVTGDKITTGTHDFHWSGTAWAPGAAA
jgi:hypothetical protein